MSPRNHPDDPIGDPAAGSSEPSAEPSAEAAATRAAEAWLAARDFSPAAALEPLAGDVSGRRYFFVRLAAAPPGVAQTGRGPGAVLALYPPSLRPACTRFLRSGELLTAAGVRVPRVLAAGCAGGRMLVEDLGAQTLDVWAEDRPWEEITPRFRAALAAARRIAALPRDGVADLSPPLDAALLRRELALTREHFLEPAGLLDDPSLARRLGAAFDDLVAALAVEPTVPCHRDFMVRNLVPLEPEPPSSSADGAAVAVLDHQDLRLGPPLYDLASLLNDTLFPPPEVTAALLAEHRAAVGTVETEAAFSLGYHRAAAQRSLKAVGSYAMAAAAGKRHHVHRIAATFERALHHLAAAPETAAAAKHLAARWRVARQDGARDLLH